MFHLALFRLLALSALGTVMYWLLLGVIGLAAGGRLQKRKYKATTVQETSKVRIIMAYLLTLIAGMIWLFLIIKFVIRGVA